ncbi:MAG: hypothetical protein V4736_12610 [Bdellovibrionota bacterium]
MIRSLLFLSLLTFSLQIVPTTAHSAPAKKVKSADAAVAEENQRLEMAIKSELSALKSIDELGAFSSNANDKWDLERRRGESYLKLSKLYRLFSDNSGKNQAEAKSYMKRGQDVLVKLLEQKKDPALSLQLAVTYKDQDQFDKALSLLAKVANDPEADADLKSDALFHQGEVYFERKNFSGALKSYEKVDPVSNIYGFSRYKKAWSLYNLKRNRDAVDELVQVYQMQKARKAARIDLKDDLIGSLALFSSEEREDTFIFNLSAKSFHAEDRDVYLKALIRLLINHGEANRAFTLLKNWKGELNGGIDFYRSLFSVEILLQQKKFGEVPGALEKLTTACPTTESSPCKTEVRDVSQKILPYYKSKPAYLSKILRTLAAYDFEPEFKSEIIQALALVEMDQKNYAASIVQWRAILEATKDKEEQQIAFSGLLKAGELLAQKDSSYRETYDKDLFHYVYVFPNGAESSAVRFRLATNAFEKKSYVTALEQLDLMGDKHAELRDAAFDLRVQCLYEMKKWEEVEKILQAALKNPDLKSKDKYEEFLDRLELRKSAEARNTDELIVLHGKSRKAAIKQDIYRLILEKAQKKVSVAEMSFLLKNLPESGLSDNLKRDTFQFLIFTAYKKDSWKDLRGQFQDFIQRGFKFVGPEEKVRFAEMDIFTNGNLHATVDCGLHFKFEIACKLAMVQKGQLKGVFDWSRKAYGQAKGPEQKRWIRYLQAQVFKAEFDAQSLKTSQPSRKSLLFAYKAEKLDKTLTALLDTLQMPAPIFFKYHVSQEVITIQENFLKDLMKDDILSQDKALLTQIQAQIDSFRQKVQEIDDMKKINAAFETVETRSVSAEAPGKPESAPSTTDSLSQIYKWIGLGTQKLGLEQTSGLISSWRKDERQFEKILLYLDI